MHLQRHQYLTERVLKDDIDYVVYLPPFVQRDTDATET